MIDRRKIPNEKQKILWNRSKQINLQAKDQYFSLLLREQISQFAFFFCQKYLQIYSNVKKNGYHMAYFFWRKVGGYSDINPLSAYFFILYQNKDDR